MDSCHSAPFSVRKSFQNTGRRQLDLAPDQIAKWWSTALAAKSIPILSRIKSPVQYVSTTLYFPNVDPAVKGTFRG